MSYVTEISTTVIACLIVGVLLGRFLDRILGTSPWLLLICSLLGAAEAIHSLFRMSGVNQDEKKGES